MIRIGEELQSNSTGNQLRAVPAKVCKVTYTNNELTLSAG